MPGQRRRCFLAFAGILLLVIYRWTLLSLEQQRSNLSDSVLSAEPWFQHHQSHQPQQYHYHVQMAAGSFGSYLSIEDILLERDSHTSPRSRRDVRRRYLNSSSCRMETCFDFSLCNSVGFLVYIYPKESGRLSSKYAQILSTIRESIYYTDDPTKACLFVLSLDTLDRDKLSSEYVDNIPQKIERLQWWRGGLNHLIFNLYSGTWPDYREEDLGFDIGKAILAKASITDKFFRTGFDISFPLFHKELSSRGAGDPGYLQSENVPSTRKYTLVFKGKRYLSGIGSETRNSLHHLHNGRDVMLLTTCRHGREWKKLRDERCEHDNRIYDRYDYKLLMYNSTFCLVPRGRRISSYRFLEALQTACIPVLLSNGLVLPFSDVIDWTRAAIWGDERLLLQIVDTLRSVSAPEILLYQQQAQFLWSAYFASVQKIVISTLEIMKERIMQNLARGNRVWNEMPGALHTHLEFSSDPDHFPFFSRPSLQEGFTAVVFVRNESLPDVPSSQIQQLLRNLSQSTYLRKVILLWQSNQPTPTYLKRHVPKHIPLLVRKVKKTNERFQIGGELDTSCALSLDEDALITPDELDFGFGAWTQMSSHIVGFAGRNHFWRASANAWDYTSKATNQFSIVLTGSAFIHKYFYFLYSISLHQRFLSVVDQSEACEDILMNMLVSHVTRQAPIKVGPRRLLNASRSSQLRLFRIRRRCLNALAGEFGYMPLLRSSARMDPLFFKDQVSISRKKFRQMELL